jgi:hypothetical protein
MLVPDLSRAGGEEQFAAQGLDPLGRDVRRAGQRQHVGY